MPTNSNVSSECDNSHDSLSSASSRKKFINELENARARADREGCSFVVCLVDIDQLRNVNDLHGQSAGDAVVLGVARESLEVLASPQWQRFDCLQARFDGDSIILLLFDCRLSDGEHLGEDLRRKCAAALFGDALRNTVSIAVTAYRSGESIDELLARTERTLHLAKQFGGDRVETAWTPEVRRRAADGASITELTRSDRSTGPQVRSPERQR
jgi:diguanylate cyclase (GGDEF)-like protein